MEACREGEFDGGQTPLFSETVYLRASGRGDPPALLHPVAAAWYWVTQTHLLEILATNLTCKKVCIS